MRILYVTPYVPSRIRVRSYGFLTQLQSEHEVTILALCTSRQELADAELLRNQGFTIVTVVESQWQSVLRSGFMLTSSAPLQVAYARSKRFMQMARRLCTQQHFDVVHVEHLRGIAAMHCLRNLCPMVWDAVDCLSLLQKHAMISGPNGVVRSLAALEYRRTCLYERKMVKQFQHILVTSERDRQAMLSLQEDDVLHGVSTDDVRETTITVLPNGVDLDYFHTSIRERKRLHLVFSGKMNYHPNIASVLYLYREIMPLIWQCQPEATLTIVGGYPPNVIRSLADDLRVEVTGYVDDIRPYIHRAEVMVCPIIYGTGIQNKVLEAMALGVPVVASSQCAQSLRALPGRNLLVADSPSQFANATLLLLNNPELRSKQSQYGRRYVEEYHNWHVAKNTLVDIYQLASMKTMI